MKKHFSTIVLSIILLIGLSFLLYPTVSDYWNSFHETRVVANYTQSVGQMNTRQLDEMWEKAEQYNEKLLTEEDRYNMTSEQESEYDQLLNVNGTGVMGYIEIPSIQVTLPIYHGIEEEVLQAGAGHIPGTSLPVGGKGTHCVISGHRGLVSAQLFTNLDQLKEGDIFTLNVLNQTLTYEVDQIRIVLPDELDDLEIDPNQDYCTLVTCTPYGINTHRLLVRGHRIANLSDGTATADALQLDPNMVAMVVAIPMLAALLILLFKKDREKKKELAKKAKKKTIKTTQATQTGKKSKKQTKKKKILWKKQKKQEGDHENEKPQS
jgi:sortase A